MSGYVRAIFLAPTRAAPVQSVSVAQAVAGQGLFGDRHFGRPPSEREPTVARHVTLIAREAFEALERETGQRFEPADSRRNVLTEGVDLDALIGREFEMGPVRMRGHALCEPCTHLEKLSGEGWLRGMLHRCGIRAEILSSGEVAVGDAVLTSS